MTQEQATILIEQLGGRKFIAMTGTKNFITDNANGTPTLRMDLKANFGGVNRLQIALNANDTYTMYFYKLAIGKSTNWEAKVTKEQTFAGVYSDMLQSIFTKVTGLYTKL